MNKKVMVKCLYASVFYGLLLISIPCTAEPDCYSYEVVSQFYKKSMQFADWYKREDARQGKTIDDLIDMTNTSARYSDDLFNILAEPTFDAKHDKGISALAKDARPHLAAMRDYWYSGHSLLKAYKYRDANLLAGGAASLLTKEWKWVVKPSLSWLEVENRIDAWMRQGWNTYINRRDSMAQIVLNSKSFDEVRWACNFTDLPKKLLARRASPSNPVCIPLTGLEALVASDEEDKGNGCSDTSGMSDQAWYKEVRLYNECKEVGGRNWECYKLPDYD